MMSNHMRVSILAAACLVAVPLAAQQASPPSAARQGGVPAVVFAPATPTVHSVPSSGPVLEPSAVGFRAHPAHPAPVPAPLLMPANGENSQNVALMVVGGAGLIVGAVIGGRSGTIVMLGSGVIGLIGLYRSVQ